MGDEAYYQLFLFIQIGNYLWNLVFHLGSQLGDETPYHLILFIQIGNYLWNLLFYLGSPNGWRAILPLFLIYSDRELLMEPSVPSGQPDGRRDVLLPLLRLLVLEYRRSGGEAGHAHLDIHHVLRPGQTPTFAMSCMLTLFIISSLFLKTFSLLAY